MGSCHLFPTFAWMLMLLLHLTGVSGQDTTLTEGQKIGLYVGCSIGGFIFLLLIVILFCLICRPTREKRYHGSREYYDNPVILGREKYVTSGPPGVWTSSNQNLYPVDSGAIIYGNGLAGGASGPPPPPVVRQHRQYTSHVNGTAAAPNVFVSDLERRPPWLHRTVRRARQALRRLPTALPGKKPGEFTYTEFHGGTASSSSAYDVDFAATTAVVFVGFGGKTNLSPTREIRQERRQADVVRGVQIGDSTAGIKAADASSEYGAETQAALERVVGRAVSPTGKSPMARVYSDYAEMQAIRDMRDGRLEAKVFSDYQDPKEFLPNDETGENVARAYSSYSELNAQLGRSGGGGGRARSPSPTRGLIRSHDSGLDRDRKIVMPTGNYYVTQSDWGVHHPTNPVGRTRSNLEHNRPSGAFNQGYQGPNARPTSPTYVSHGDARRSQDKMYQKLASDPVRYNYMLKKDSEMVEQLRYQGSPVLARRPNTTATNPVTRSASDASNVKHFQIPSDPNAVYAFVDKARRPNSGPPRPGSPIPPIIPQQEPVLRNGEHRYVVGGNGTRVNVQAVIENGTRPGRRPDIRGSVNSSAPDTIAQEGEHVTSKAFQFLEAYSCAPTEDGLSVHSRSTDLSLQSGELFTAQVFGFLNDYPDQEDAHGVEDDAKSQSSSTSTVIERSAHDAFKFLDDFDEMSFGEEAENLAPGR